jgi:uncharacterized protein YjiS (DUF1127 family)
VSADIPATLVKYCTYDTGLKILSERTLRWSSPHLFGDPFELDYLTPHDVTAARLAEILLREALIMLFGPDVPTGRSNKLVNVMARWREEQRFCDEEEASTVLRELLGQIADLQAAQVDEFMANWRNYARTVRICSFSERPNLLNCWSRFADNHTGLALRFDCGDDTALPVPKPVQYQASPAAITSLKEQVDAMLGRGAAPLHDDFQGKLLIKGRHQQSELEWRCFDNDRDDPTSDEKLWYSDRRFPTHELRQVYLGARMPSAARDAILRLVKRDYPGTRILQAQVIPGRYELELAPLPRT